jgi:hypothetical protein
MYLPRNSRNRRFVGTLTALLATGTILAGLATAEVTQSKLTQFQRQTPNQTQSPFNQRFTTKPQNQGIDIWGQQTRAIDSRIDQMQRQDTQDRFERIMKNPFQPPRFAQDSYKAFGSHQGHSRSQRRNEPRHWEWCVPPKGINGSQGELQICPKPLSRSQNEPKDAVKSESSSTRFSRPSLVSQHSTSNTWTQRNGKFQYGQQIGDKHVKLQGTASRDKLNVDAIEITAPSGKQSSFKTIEEVPLQYRGEVQAAVKNAQRNVN